MDVTLKNSDPGTYALVFDQSREDLKRQEAALDELRSRTGTLIGASALVASFLGVAAAGDGLGLAGILGVIAFVASAGLAIAILMPIHAWIFTNDITALLKDYVEADPPATLVEMHRDLAIHASGHIRNNERWLRILYRLFRGATILLVIEVLLLLLDLPSQP
jgi:hypothetical protein